MPPAAPRASPFAHPQTESAAPVAIPAPIATSATHSIHLPSTSSGHVRTSQATPQPTIPNQSLSAATPSALAVAAPRDVPAQLTAPQLEEESTTTDLTGAGLGGAQAPPAAINQAYVFCVLASTTTGVRFECMAGNRSIAAPLEVSCHAAHVTLPCPNIFIAHGIITRRLLMMTTDQISRSVLAERLRGSRPRCSSPPEAIQRPSLSITTRCARVLYAHTCVYLIRIYISTCM